MTAMSLLFRLYGDVCDSFISDVSVNSKPSITELYAVNDEAFMVDKKYVNVTDLNLMSDEKVSIFIDRDDLEKKIDDVQVLDNVVCVDRNKNVYGSEAKTSAVVASVVIKEVVGTQDNVDVNTMKLVIEDVDFAGYMCFCWIQKISISDRDDLEKKIHDVQVLDNVVCVDRTKCYDGKQDESGDIDLNNCPDIPNFAADADSNEL
ncbi:hypothetical protein Tco_0626123 [Tanacetum coccineum]|uniref:Uncharacterized protein n=1 Tax=Tanacetum coccineum TaxID=301880 RepID=A0ABQ4WIP7_9ASTR